MDMMSRIRDLMDERDLNQNAVANIAGVSKGAVSQWFSGGFEPKASSLAKLADYFGVSVEYLMTGEGGSVRPSPSKMVPDSVVEGNMSHAGSTTKTRHYQRVTMRAKCMAADMLAESLEDFR